MIEGPVGQVQYDILVLLLGALNFEMIGLKVSVIATLVLGLTTRISNV
jgi:hypothetical protein